MDGNRNCLNADLWNVRLKMENWLLVLRTCGVECGITTTSRSKWLRCAGIAHEPPALCVYTTEKLGFPRSKGWFSGDNWYFKVINIVVFCLHIHHLLSPPVLSDSKTWNPQPAQLCRSKHCRSSPCLLWLPGLSCSNHIFEQSSWVNCAVLSLFHPLPTAVPGRLPASASSCGLRQRRIPAEILRPAPFPLDTDPTPLSLPLSLQLCHLCTEQLRISTSHNSSLGSLGSLLNSWPSPHPPSFSLCNFTDVLQIIKSELSDTQCDLSPPSVCLLPSPSCFVLAQVQEGVVALLLLVPVVQLPSLAFFA